MGELDDIEARHTGKWILPTLIFAIAAIVVVFWTMQASYISKQSELQNRLEQTIQRSVFVAESVVSSETCSMNPDIQICVHSQKLIDDFSEIEQEMEK